MPERTLLRIGSVSAILGAILLLIGFMLTPRNLDFTDLAALFQTVADSTIWIGAHIGLMVGGLLVLGGLVALYRSITGDPGAALARLGFVAALVGIVLLIITTAIAGVAGKGVAEAWATAPIAEKAAAFRVADAVVHLLGAFTSMWIFVLLGVTFILYGLAVARSQVYAQWLGWVAVVVGIGGALIGLVHAYQGFSELLTNILLPVPLILFILWMLVMGVLMWRKARAAT